MVTKIDVLRLLDQLSEDELRIVYTFIEEYRAAVDEEDTLTIPQIKAILQNEH